jgi:hypothetical protein
MQRLPSPPQERSAPAQYLIRLGVPGFLDAMGIVFSFRSEQRL